MTSCLRFCVLILLLSGVKGQAEILDNPSFEDPLTGYWTCNVCTGSRSTSSPKDGSYAYLASSRTQTWQGPIQELPLGTNFFGGRYYYFSGYVRVSSTSSSAGPQRFSTTLVYRRPGGNSYQGVAGATEVVSADGWVHVGADFKSEDYADATSAAIYIEGPDTGVDFEVDFLSLKGITVSSNWTKEAKKRIRNIRKGKLKIKIRSNTQHQLNIEIKQASHEFGFGSAVDSQALQNNIPYKQWYLDNFEWAVLENDFKWRQTELTEGSFTWDNADDAMAILKANNKKVRGHTICWAQTIRNPQWVQDITTPTRLYDVVMKRVDDILGRYKGELEHWDVNNEMLANSFYLDGYNSDYNIRYDMFNRAKQVDPDTKLFLNDYNVVANSVSTDRYVAQAKMFVAASAPVEGLGVQSHLSSNDTPVEVYWHRLDRLGVLALPIWVTELDYADADEQVRADTLERALMAYFSHPSVDGVLFWGFWEDRHWRGTDAALVVGANMTETAAGNMWKRLFHEKWRSNKNIRNVRTRDQQSTMRIIRKVFYGTYEVTVTPQNGAPITKSVQVKKSTGRGTVTFNI